MTARRPVRRLPTLSPTRCYGDGTTRAGDKAKIMVDRMYCRESSTASVSSVTTATWPYYLGVASAGAGICDESAARLSSFSMYHVVKVMYAPQMTTGK
jgi:hypothetical protein